MTAKKTHQYNYLWNICLSITFLISLLLIGGCGGDSKRLIKELPEDDRNFISKVRYIITKSEKKKFLSLVTSADRAQFRAEFWKKRDPDLSTGLNEFKRQYFQRIEEANRTFTETGQGRGWLSDRGRVYILLGPPEYKQVYPTGYRVNDLPSEVWVYGFFPIIFVDNNRSGDYRLTPLGAWHVAEIAKARRTNNPKVAKVQSPFGFNLKLTEDKDNNRHNLNILMPYRNVIFEEGEDGYKADIVLYITINNTLKKDLETMNQPHTIFVKSGELDKLSKTYVINVPLSLPSGKYKVAVVVENKADNIKVKDSIAFNIK